MTDLESRLADSLREGAQDAPSAVGLAAAARTRARQRRRTKQGVAAAVVVLGVGLPAAIVAGGQGDPADPSMADDPVELDNGVPDGYRVESWQSVTIEVPDTWGYGSISQWCVGGDLGPPTPVVDRPGVSTQVLCSPASGYGVSFAPSEGHDVQWPVAEQNSEAWPPGTFVGATTVDDVVVTVAVPDARVAMEVLGSARRTGPEGDPNGCSSSVDEPRPDLPEGVMAVCRYDERGLLEQSEALTGDDLEAAFSALESAPFHSVDCVAAPPERHVVVRMSTAQLRADVQLSEACPAVSGLGSGTRELTADVVYWALSPGWSGALDGAIPLPEELRQR
jgi:hypothetical protein